MRASCDRGNGRGGTERSTFSQCRRAAAFCRRSAGERCQAASSSCCVPVSGAVVFAALSRIMTSAPAASVTMWQMTAIMCVNVPLHRTTAMRTGHSRVQSRGREQ
ncbi:MAG TPA: hypothetical protein VGM10_28180 [Actinocrinis sp.]